MNRPVSGRWAVGPALCAFLLVAVACASGQVPVVMPSSPPTLAPTPGAGQTDLSTVASTATVPFAPSPTASPAAPRVGGTWVTIAPMEPSTLDPQKVMGSEVTAYLGGALVTTGPGQKYYPYLAERWKTSEDTLVWDFALKRNIKFHDGTPLTANDFVWTYNRALDPDTGATASRANLAMVQSIEVLDDYTLRITLKQPMYPFMFALTDSGYMQPLPRGAVESRGDSFGRSPIGVGPFKFQQWITGDRIILTRNPDYDWGPSYAHAGPSYLDKVEVRFIPEYATALAGLEAGEITAALAQPKDVQRLRDSGRFQIIESYVVGMWPNVFRNVGKPPFDDVRVRQALNYAVDARAVITAVTNGMASPQAGPFSPSTMGYWKGTEALAYPFDLAKAKALLADAGYVAGSDGVLAKEGQRLALSLIVAEIDPSWTKLAEVLQQQWKALGIDVQVQRLEVSAALFEILTGDYTIGIGGYDWAEADMLYLQFHSSQIGGLNWSRVSDPKLDQLVEATRTTSDPAKRQDVVNEAVKYIIDQAYVLPIYSTKRFMAVDIRADGLIPIVGSYYGYAIDDAYFSTGPRD